VYKSSVTFSDTGYGTCITTNYEILKNGNVSVLNTQLDENNEIEQISGYAYYIKCSLVKFNSFFNLSFSSFNNKFSLITSSIFIKVIQ